MHAAGPLILRGAVGLVFVAHGAQKLFGIWGGGGPAGTAAFFEQLGLRPAYFLALLVGTAELVGGLLLMAGAFTLIASGVLAGIMLVAIWKVHLPEGFFLNWLMTPGEGHGIEFNLVLIASLVALMFTGAGALSIDAHRVRSAETAASNRARLRSGI